ncbi:B3 domain-containing protein [Platanthera zijinensis]|uniref:B3 domain-containing protein n=1 Tax=Platanthera zijinensis TaxID=2320716 RepID=A0AAP0BS60_9ASPA
MKTEERLIGRERRRKKQESLECPPTPLKAKRGRKPRSPSPQAPSPPSLPPPSSPGPFSFFKIMIGDFNKVLYIPPMAACTLKDLEKKFVYIEDTDGKYWNVKISMVDGSLAFQKGWDEFFSAHSITVGEFVLFTYTGGLLFTARIFGTSSLERVDFRVKKKRGRCAKERCITELKPDLVPLSKRKKVSHAFEVKQSQSNNDVTQMLERGKESAQFDFPSAKVVESDPIIQVVVKVPIVCKEPLNYDSNCKECENVFDDSEQALCRNTDATVDEVNKVEESNIKNPTELIKLDACRNVDATVDEANKVEEPNVKDPTELIKLDAENFEAFANEPDDIEKTRNFTFKAHSDNKLALPEISDSHKMGTNGEMEESTSHNLEILISEPHSENTNVLSNPEHAECSQVEFDLIKPDAIPDKLFLTVDGKCYKTLDENLAEIATETSFNVNGHEELTYQNEHANFGSKISAPCEDISEISSNHTLVFPSNEKESLISTNEEYEDLQIKERNQMESDMIEPNGISSKIFLTADGICYNTLDENLTEIATGTCLDVNEQEDSICQNEHSVSVVSSNCILVCGTIKEENLVPRSEEYGGLQLKECSQMGISMIEPDGVADKVCLTSDGICHNTLDDKFAELAIETSFINGEEEPACQDENATFGSEITVPCELISVVSSNPMLLCASEKKEILMSTSEENGDLQMKGIGHDAFIDEDVRDATPCSSCKSNALTERRDSVDLPSPTCVSFSVCLSDDLQSSLELPNKLISQVGKSKNERKVVLLQDLSMKCWPVLYHQSINFIGFIGGWVDFARANNICRGDICEFELLSKTELKFLVQIRKEEESMFDDTI